MFTTSLKFSFQKLADIIFLAFTSRYFNIDVQSRIINRASRLNFCVIFIFSQQAIKRIKEIAVRIKKDDPK